MPYMQTIEGAHTFDDDHSSYKVIDKRSASQEPQSTTSDDSARLRKRAWIKSEWQKARLADERHRELIRELNELLDQKDALAAQHVSTCEPIQSQLRELQDRQLQVMKDGGDLAALHDEERELRRQVVMLNAELEQKLDELDRQINALERERVQVAKQCDTSQFRTQLIQAGDPEKLRLHRGYAQLLPSLQRADGAAAVEIRRFATDRMKELEKQLLEE